MTTSSALRLCLVGLVLMTGLSAAWLTTCPAYPTGTDQLYEADNCTQVDQCADLACQCLSGSSSCDTWDFTTSCSNAVGCLAKYNLCLVEAAEAIVATASTIPSCNTWANAFHTKQVAAAASYADSDAEGACKAVSCYMMNMTVADGNCTNNTVPYEKICFSPSDAPVTTLSFVLGGNWSSIELNETAKLELIVAMEKDLKAYFGYPVTINSVTVDGTSGAVTANFTIFAVRADLGTKISTISTIDMTNTKSAYTAITGESPSAISVGSVTDPTASSSSAAATSSATSSSSVAASSGASSNSTASASSSSSSGPGDTSGASAAATLASVAVAMLVAILAL